MKKLGYTSREAKNRNLFWQIPLTLMALLLMTMIRLIPPMILTIMLALHNPKIPIRIDKT